MNMRGNLDLAGLGHLMRDIADRADREGLPGWVRIRSLVQALEVAEIDPRGGLGGLPEPQAEAVRRVALCVFQAALRHHDGANQAG